MFKELDCIALTADIPADGLKEADVGTIMHAYPGGSAFIVEFQTLDGNTAAIIEVSSSPIRPVSDNDIAHARTMKIGV